MTPALEGSRIGNRAGVLAFVQAYGLPETLKCPQIPPHAF